MFVLGIIIIAIDLVIASVLGYSVMSESELFVRYPKVFCVLCVLCATLCFAGWLILL